MKRLCCLLLLLTVISLSVHAQIRVALVLDDNYGIAAHEAVISLLKNPEVSSKCEIKVFTYSNYWDADIDFLERVNLAFVYTHNTKVIEQAKPQLLKAIRKGAKVYALNTSPADEEYGKSGILFQVDVLSYFAQKGRENMENMVLSRLQKDFSLRCRYKTVQVHPDMGIYDCESDTIYTEFPAFLRNYREHKEGNPWIGMVVGIHELLMGQQEYIKSHIRYMEKNGFNVLPIYGSPVYPAMEKFFTDENGKTRIVGIAALALWHGIKPEALKSTLKKLDIPVVNCIQLYETFDEWDASPQGISVTQRANFLALPELSGLVQPTVTASRERIPFHEDILLRKSVINPQLKQMLGRLKSWYALRVKPNAEKKIAVVYYSYPPGKANIGASYLNVLPQSLHTILRRMESEGYNLGGHAPLPDTLFQQVMQSGRNVGNWSPAEVNALVQTGEALLLPVDTYRKWYPQLSPSLQTQVEAKWGKPEHSDIMTWSDRSRKKYFVFPAVRYGNILLTPQPARGWGQDVTKMYHDVSLPPHHQYIAFYLYLKHGYRADAVIHLGTHGTHEWLSGKETGLNDNDPPEALIADMVNIYPYIVDNVGEGLQAKRRGMAVIIDHLTPPFDKAGMNPELKELAALISDYEAAEGTGPVLAESKMKSIRQLAEKLGLMKDLGLTTLDDEALEVIEHYIKEIAEKQTPFGLHTFGKSPDESNAKRTAEAIVSRQKNISQKEKNNMRDALEKKLGESGERELDALMAALNGRYITAGTGNDPLRNPASLPTGKNFYAFDPERIPTQSTYETGFQLAKELLDGYPEKHGGKYPEKVTMNLWSTECIRHEGIMESQILALMGVKPVWDSYGRVKGVEAIPQKVLNRPRIDVVVVPSGLYRDIFPNLMQLIDRAVETVKRMDEADNYIRTHIARAREILRKQGITDAVLIERLASVRMFSVPPGAYGTGIANVTEASDTWDDECRIADVYFNRMGHLYGQGFWGDKPEESNSSLPGHFSTELLKNALSGTDVVVHSRSSNVYAALDNDDFFQYLGATAMAIRVIDKKHPEVMVTNLTDPSAVGQETLDKFIGREMQTRYLNPQWINEMMKEGYAGARFINKVVTNLWGWQVTVPDAIDENKWQQMYETYIEDKYDLDIKKKFEESQNLYAYQNVLARMLETIRKAYWHPEEKVMERLLKEFGETVKEVGLSCDGNVCNNEKLSGFIKEHLSDVPGIGKKDIKRYDRLLESMKKEDVSRQAIPNPDRQLAKESDNRNAQYMPKTEVKGYEIQEIARENEPQKDNGSVKIGLLLLIVALLAAVAWKRNK